MPVFAPLDRVEATHAVDASDHLTVAGPDAPDLLHRISASELRDLSEGSCRHLVFTNDKGGLVDAPLVTPFDGGFRMIAGPGRGKVLQDWIEKWVILDDVQIEPNAGPAWRLGEPDLVENTSSVLRPTTGAGPAILIGEAGEKGIGLDDWESMNFRAGRLYTGPATSSAPIPLELGWKDFISFDKGCYIGQEVIARLDTYDKVRRGLSVAELSGPVDPGSRLSHDERRCGIVLSTVRIEDSYFAWVVVNQTLAAGAALVGETQTAGTLLRAPAGMA